MFSFFSVFYTTAHVHFTIFIAKIFILYIYIAFRNTLAQYVLSMKKDIVYHNALKEKIYRMYLGKLKVLQNTIFYYDVINQ